MSRIPPCVETLIPSDVGTAFYAVSLLIEFPSAAAGRTVCIIIEGKRDVVFHSLRMQIVKADRRSRSGMECISGGLAGLYSYN
jgi:hypothetical protein